MGSKQNSEVHSRQIFQIRIDCIQDKNIFVSNKIKNAHVLIFPKIMYCLE